MRKTKFKLISTKTTRPEETQRESESAISITSHRVISSQF